MKDPHTEHSIYVYTT